ncbi:hypothetical protein H6F43_02940, partial [Leptolyngbya sp. FACHB-36]|nr:hypothetical protein [Leptolyngbya sp. FACHB-36]
MTNPDRWTASSHTLFPTALFVFNLHDYEALNQRLLTLIYRLKQSDRGQTASNVLGWHSKGNLFEFDEV